MKKLIISALVGIFLGAIVSKFLFVGSFLNLVPWGIVGLIVGLISNSYKRAAVNGAMYGFFLAFSFMVSGYQGSESLLSRVPPFAALGLIGAVCGAILALLGYTAGKLANKSSAT